MTSARTMRGAVSILVVGALILNTSGCALGFTQGPPRNHAQRTFFHCDRNSAAAGNDIVAALLLSPTVIGGIVFMLSAVTGFSNASKCRDALHAFDVALQSVMELPEGKRPDVTIASVAIVGGDTVRVGQSAVLHASALNAGGTAIAGRLFEWSSANATVVAVDESGTVSPKAAGSVEVSAVTGGVKGSRTIVVVP